MKKLIFTLMLVCGSALLSMAKEETLYEIYENGNKDTLGSYYYVIDRDAQRWRFDSDSEDEAEMIIKNYKKSGNTETFDLYFKCSPTQYRCSIKIDVNSEGESVLYIIYKKQNYTRSYIVGDLKKRKEYFKSKGKNVSSDSSDEISVSAIADKAKDKAKGLLNKGKGLLKKK